MTEPSESGPEFTSIGGLIARASIQSTFAVVIWAGLLWLGAGTMLWPRAWVHLGLWGIAAVVNMAVLLRTNRPVVEARLKPRASSQPSDRIVMALFQPVALAIPLVAGLDTVRYQWTSIAVWGLPLGIALHVAGDALLLWAMIVNPYSEKAVRIQTERAHRVITTGPYALVRHPMYSGIILLLTAIPLVLGSQWTFAPIGAMVLLLMVRAVLEDRMLRSDLPGYKQYARRTRYRMLPGVW